MFSYIAFVISFSFFSTSLILSLAPNCIFENYELPLEILDGDSDACDISEVIPPVFYPIDGITYSRAPGFIIFFINYAWFYDIFLIEAEFIFIIAICFFILLFSLI